MHFVEDADRERMEKTLWKSFKSGGEKVFPTAGTGWIKNQPEITGTQHLFIGDVRKLTGQRILDAIGMKRGELDCVAGGPPCQGFSNSGKRDVMDPRNSLVFDYARLIIELNPKTMIMENVPGILTMVTPEGIPVVDAFARILEDGGFSGIDALKKSIAAQTGAVGILRSSRTEKAKAKAAAVEDATAVIDQADLFSEAC
ncbi:MAG: DNA cytosine methyltransferase [Caulobacterales bacterium]|nr:DNA cytosine methyltransferase [Caulobacterales bacterium]